MKFYRRYGITLQYVSKGFKANTPVIAEYINSNLFKIYNNKKGVVEFNFSKDRFLKSVHTYNSVDSIIETVTAMLDIL